MSVYLQGKNLWKHYAKYELAFSVISIKYNSRFTLNALHEAWFHKDHRTARQRSPSSYGDRILGSNRNIFRGIGSRFSGAMIKTTLQGLFTVKIPVPLAFVV